MYVSIRMFWCVLCILGLTACETPPLAYNFDNEKYRFIDRLSETDCEFGWNGNQLVKLAGIDCEKRLIYSVDGEKIIKTVSVDKEGDRKLNSLDGGKTTAIPVQGRSFINVQDLTKELQLTLPIQKYPDLFFHLGSSEREDLFVRQVYSDASRVFVAIDNPTRGDLFVLLYDKLNLSTASLIFRQSYPQRGGVLESFLRGGYIPGLLDVVDINIFADTSTELVYIGMSQFGSKLDKNLEVQLNQLKRQVLVAVDENGAPVNKWLGKKWGVIFSELKVVKNFFISEKSKRFVDKCTWNDVTPAVSDLQFFFKANNERYFFYEPIEKAIYSTPHIYKKDSLNNDSRPVEGC